MTRKLLFWVFLSLATACVGTASANLCTDTTISWSKAAGQLAPLQKEIAAQPNIIDGLESAAKKSPIRSPAVTDNLPFQLFPAARNPAKPATTTARWTKFSTVESFGMRQKLPAAAT
jgi:hypothetical protein